MGIYNTVDPGLKNLTPGMRHIPTKVLNSDLPIEDSLNDRDLSGNHLSSH